MNIFLTGGTGFIGSNILLNLLGDGHNVVCLARNIEKTKIFPSSENLKFVIGDISDSNLIYDSLENIDAVIHVALHWGEGASNMLLNDTLSSIKLFENVAKRGIKRVIYTSSTAVADYSRKINDETQPTMPNDYYGATKASTENYLHAISKQHNIKTTVIRPGYTFANPALENGDMEVDSRFRDIVKSVKNSEDINLIKYDGTQFIWAQDLAKIYISALNKQKSNFEIYYGLSKEFVTWEEVAKIAISLSDSKSKIITKDVGNSETPNVFDVSKIERDFGLNFRCKEKIEDHVKYLLSL